jgi:hypothetical protein
MWAGERKKQHEKMKQQRQKLGGGLERMQKEVRDEGMGLQV